MEFTGRIIAILPARSGVSKQGTSWMTQDYVIEETTGQYPKRMCFNVFGEDNIRKFALAVNMEVIVKFDINAREYQGRWYNDIRAWSVEDANAAQQQGGIPQPATAQQPASQQVSSAQLSPEHQQIVNNVKDAFGAEEVSANDPNLPF